jgi:hypothetical protein
MIYDQVTMSLVHCFLLGGISFFYSIWNSCDVLVVSVVLIQEIDHCSRIFYNFFYFLLYASVMHYGTHCCSGWMYWYLYDINILLVLKIYMPFHGCFFHAAFFVANVFSCCRSFRSIISN